MMRWQVCWSRRQQAAIRSSKQQDSLGWHGSRMAIDDGMVMVMYCREPWHWREPGELCKLCWRGNWGRAGTGIDAEPTGPVLGVAPPVHESRLSPMNSGSRRQRNDNCTTIKEDDYQGRRLYPFIQHVCLCLSGIVSLSSLLRDTHRDSRLPSLSPFLPLVSSLLTPAIQDSCQPTPSLRNQHTDTLHADRSFLPSSLDTSRRRLADLRSPPLLQTGQTHET